MLDIRCFFPRNAGGIKGKAFMEVFPDQECFSHASSSVEDEEFRPAGLQTLSYVILFSDSPDHKNTSKQSVLYGFMLILEKYSSKRGYFSLNLRQ